MADRSDRSCVDQRSTDRLNCAADRPICGNSHLNLPFYLLGPTSFRPETARCSSAQSELAIDILCRLKHRGAEVMYVTQLPRPVLAHRQTHSDRLELRSRPQ